MALHITNDSQIVQINRGDADTQEGGGQNNDSDDCCESPLEVTTSNGLSAIAAEKKEIRIVLAGKSGAGKSTLARNLLEDEQKFEIAAGPLTQECDTKEITRNDITIKITDTVGLGYRKGISKKELQKLYRHTKGKADLLLYCIPVDLSSKFDDSNPAIMKSLHDAYGKNIWKHCIIVFTFSNLALERIKKKSENEEEAIVKYKSHLLEYATLFMKELKKFNVLIPMKTIFEFQHTTTKEDQNKIVAIPAGDDLADQVLPDFKGPEHFNIAGNGRLEESVQVNITDWRETLFIEIVKKCGSVELKKNLLQFRYGYAMAKSFGAASGVAAGAAGGFVGGAAIGAGVGALIGLLGGPFGVLPGAMVGAAVGGTTAAAAGGAGGGIIRKLFRR